MTKQSLKRRQAFSVDVKATVLTEAGYRCAVPTCRSILAIDLHHLVKVADGGDNNPSNLIALCPTCHALHHRGTITRDSLYVYKSIIVSLSHAFDVEAIDKLLFLRICPKDYLVVSGDGLLHFSRLIAANFVAVEMKANNNWNIVTYALNLTPKGVMLIDAWKSGLRSEIVIALGESSGGHDEA